MLGCQKAFIWFFLTWVNSFTRRRVYSCRQVDEIGPVNPGDLWSRNGSRMHTDAFPEKEIGKSASIHRGSLNEINKNENSW
jgi:hypothetical protein